jgi:glutathione-independent formaldehyde dehydrogenase
VRAVVFQGTREVRVENVDDPRIEAPTDVIVRVTTSALCGSDLHMYDGRMASARPGLVLGHEPLGIVEEVGAAVVHVKRGDRVVMPTHVCCAFCDNCVRGFSAACLTVNPPRYGAAYGYAGMGPYRGAQAEYLRVPFADANCLPLPGGAGDELEDDFVLLADAFVTGWHACELAEVGAGSTVAIFGAGTIGLLAAMSAYLRGAAEVYVVDAIDDRLRLAEALGAAPIDVRRGDPVEQLFALRRSPRRAGPRGPSEEQMLGVTSAIDAVGFQARNPHDWSREAPAAYVEALAKVVAPTGSVGIAGVWVPKDADPADPAMAEGKVTVAWGQFFQKGVSVRFGRTHDERYNLHLRDLILAGRAKPSRVVTRHAALEEAPDAYGRFDRREEGYVKVLFRP